MFMKKIGQLIFRIGNNLDRSFCVFKYLDGSYRTDMIARGAVEQVVRHTTNTFYN